jgi:hypothetical protein
MKYDYLGMIDCPVQEQEVDQSVLDDANPDLPNGAVGADTSVALPPET